MRFFQTISAVRLPAGLALLGLSASGMIAAETAAATRAPAVEIGVRSSVDERWEGVHRRGPIEHGKVYLIASLNQSPSEKKLVQPVDEAALLREFRKALDTQGFREITAGETPEVVLTLLYGRGHLRNPYLANIAGDITAGSIAPTPMESQLAASIDPRLYDKRMSLRYESKVMVAQKEKLFIRVSAWKYPGDRKETPVLFWKTTMVVDEPDVNDLNALYPQMLAAGVRFFDRVAPEEEVTISTAVPEGTVKLAPLVILEPEERAGQTPEKPAGQRPR